MVPIQLNLLSVGYAENEVTHTDVKIYYLAGFFYST